MREDFPRIYAEVETAAKEHSHNHAQEKPRQPLTATVLLHCHPVLLLCHNFLSASPAEREQDEKEQEEKEQDEKEHEENAKQEKNVNREKQNKQKKAENTKKRV